MWEENCLQRHERLGRGPLLDLLNVLPRQRERDLGPKVVRVEGQQVGGQEDAALNRKGQSVSRVSTSLSCGRELTFVKPNDTTNVNGRNPELQLVELCVILQSQKGYLFTHRVQHS
jgi:hypothetical protein